MTSKVPHNQLRASIQFSELSSEGTNDDCCSPVQDDLWADTAFFLDKGSLTEDHLLQRSEMHSYPLYENTGNVSISQVTGGLIGSENRCEKRMCDFLPCNIHATISHDDHSQFHSTHWLSQRRIDDKVSRASNLAGHTSCFGFGYSQKMHTQENRADDISASTKLMDSKNSAANSKHSLLNSELEQSGSDQLDSVTDCHMLVENIWNSSLMLFASHSFHSVKLSETDVEILLSVIRSLSNYLTHIAGVSAKCIQAAAQSNKSDFDDDSSISKKISKLAECYYRELDPADNEKQVSNLSDICSALKGTHVAEGGPYATGIMAEFDQLPGTPYEKANQSDLENERESKMSLSELEDAVKKLNDALEFETKLRDAAILYYKNKWSKAHVALVTTMSGIEHIKAEVKALKQYLLNKDVIGGEICKIRERSLGTCLEVNLNKKELVTDQAAMYQGKYCKEPDMNTSLMSPTNIISKENDGSALWDRAAILISCAGGLRETYKIKEKKSSICPMEDALNTERNVTDQGAIYKGKHHMEPGMNERLISPTDIISKECDEKAFWEEAAVPISCEEGFREIYKIDDKTSLICHVEDDERNVTDQTAMYQGKDHKEHMLHGVPRMGTFQGTGLGFQYGYGSKRKRFYMQNDRGHVSHMEFQGWGWGRRRGCRQGRKPRKSIPVERCKEPDINTNLISPTDVISKSYDERGFWERANLLISREEGLREMFEEKTSSICPVEDYLNQERNVTEQTATYQLKDQKKPDMNTSFVSATDIISKAYDEGAVWERAAVLISREENLRASYEDKEETSYVSPVEDDFNLESNVTEHVPILPFVRKDCEESQTRAISNSLINVTLQDSYLGQAASLFSQEQSLEISEVNRNECYYGHDIHEVSPGIEDVNSFENLQEYKESDTVEGDSGKQAGDASFDVSDSLNNSLHLDEVIANDLNPESCKSNHVLFQASQRDGTFEEWASLLLSREKTQRESVTSETRGKANSECSIKDELCPQLNVIDQTTIPSHQNVCENPRTKKNMNCLMNSIPQESDEIWKQAAIMFSSQECCAKSDRTSNLITSNQDRLERIKILCRFKALQECSHHSNITVKDSCKQFGEANFHESGSCNCSHVEENVGTDLNTECYKSNQDNSQAIQFGGPSSQSVYPNTDQVQERLGVLHHRDALWGEKEDFQPIVMSNDFEKQASCKVAKEYIHDIVNLPYGTEHLFNSHSGLKMAFGREKFPCIVPATESSSEENALMTNRNPSNLSRLELYNLVSVPDVSVDGQSINSVRPISNPHRYLNDRYSGTESGNKLIMDGHSHIFSACSISMPRLDLDIKDITGMKNQNCSDASKDSADAECLSQELSCISECQHDNGQDTFSCEMDSSSTHSESSWQYVEEEEIASFQC